MKPVISILFLIYLHTSYGQVELTATGLLATVFTPLNEDQTVNVDVILPYAKYLADSGLKFVIVGELDSELMNLSVDDATTVCKAWSDASKITGLGILIQVGAAPFVTVPEFARLAARLEGVVAVTTYPDLVAIAKNVSGLVDFVSLVAAAAPKLPILYEHIPSVNYETGKVSMPEFVIAATKAIPNFRGIRYESFDDDGYNTFINSQEGQEIFPIADKLLAATTALGLKSSTGTIYNIFPKLAQQIVIAVTSGDYETARYLNFKMAQAVSAIRSKGRWVPTMKATMEMVTGIPMGPPLLPERQISKKTLECIRQDLLELGMIEC